MFRRQLSLELEERLTEPRGFMQVVAGPRQTGKTTAISQAVKAVNLPSRMALADDAASLGKTWIESEWLQARHLAKSSDNRQAVLVLDEIQKIEGWSDTVKRLWDEDCWDDVPLKVVLSGSSSLLLAKGLADSLAGRFELMRSTHWSFAEMEEAFGYSLDDYLRFGGFPGASRIRKSAARWLAYMRDSIIETTIAKDVLQMEDVRKPALMRQLFELGCQFSAQELSYNKILGQLQDRGNTETVKHYLTLLSRAGMLCGLPKYDPKQVRTRASSPRLAVYDTSLMVAEWKGENLFANPALKGHLVESAVGASLLARGQLEGFDVHWWREGSREVDFVVSRGSQVVALEVKSGRVGKLSGMSEFLKRFPDAQPLVVGDRNLPLEDFLRDQTPLFL